MIQTRLYCRWIEIHFWIRFSGFESCLVSVEDGHCVSVGVAATAAAPDDHRLVGELVPAVDLQVREAVVADLEVSHRAEDRDEGHNQCRVAEPIYVTYFHCNFYFIEKG